MLKRSIYTLLIAAITLNIGAGIWYNGIPGILESPRGSFERGDVLSNDLVIPISRQGDIYVTSYNMSLEFTSSEEEEESGSYRQDGIITYSIGADQITQDLKGVFDLVYNKSGSSEHRIFGDVERSRAIYRDPMIGSWVEDCETSLLAATPFTKQRQSSELRVHLDRPNENWGDGIWMDLIRQCGPLNITSSGVLSNRISIDEMGSSFPAVELGWKVRTIYQEHGDVLCWIDMGPENADSIQLQCSFLLSDASPHPIEMVLGASREYESSSGMVFLELDVHEVLLDHFSGDGDIIGDMNPWSTNGKYESIESFDNELLPREGTGESAFWSYPVEVFDHSRTESTSLGDFISENGVENLGYRRITYLRNETYPSTIRDWNITLGSDPDFASGDGYFFQVATSAEIGVVPRNFMEISGEGRIEDLSVFGKTPRVITLERFETALRSSDHSERMFVGNEHAPTFGMEIIRRVPDDQSALASLFNSAVGIETAEECDLFIGHVQDRSDPMKLYVVVVDGRTGEIISTAEAEGLCIFLVNRYGLDLA